jgi:antitoxin Phd
MREVQLREAKASLSAMVDQAEAGNEVVITRHGRKAAVLMSWEQFERLKAVPSFGRLLMAAPFGEEDIPDRDQTPHSGESF